MRAKTLNIDPKTNLVENDTGVRLDENFTLYVKKLKNRRITLALISLLKEK